MFLRILEISIIARIVAVHKETNGVEEYGGNSLIITVPQYVACPDDAPPPPNGEKNAKNKSQKKLIFSVKAQ